MRHAALLVEAALPFLCVTAVAGAATHFAPLPTRELPFEIWGLEGLKPHTLWMAAVSYLAAFSIMVISWRTLTQQTWPTPREVLEASARYVAKTLNLSIHVVILLSPLLMIILPLLLLSQLFKAPDARIEGHRGTLLLFGGWIFFGFLVLSLFRDLHPMTAACTWGLQLTFIASAAMLVHHDLALVAQELDEPSSEPVLV